jgi:hypothetical protein
MGKNLVYIIDKSRNVVDLVAFSQINPIMPQDLLDAEIAAFEAAPPRPSDKSLPVVVYFEGQAQSWFKSVPEAYLWAKDRFPANAYLVRDVMEEQPFLPLLIMAS